MTANNSKFYLGYLNKLVDVYNNTNHYSIGKESIDADYSALTEEIEANPKVAKFEVGDRVRITKYKNIFSRCCTEKNEYLWLILCWKLILWCIKLEF